MNNWTKSDESNFIREIYHRGINAIASREALKLYLSTAKHLTKGIKEAFTGKKEEELFLELRENVYIFSGAKTYTQVKDISSLIVENGTLRPFGKFKKLAKERLSVYNVDYLQAEYETAIGQAQTAVKWQQIESNSKTFPYLQRRAVMDANTSPECVILNKIIARVGDPIWRTRSPLTHFRCRCTLTQIDKYEDVVLSSARDKRDAMAKTDHINPLFKGNPGIDKVIFNKSHPYFDIEPKEKELAKRNFNFPI